MMEAVVVVVGCGGEYLLHKGLLRAPVWSRRN